MEEVTGRSARFGRARRRLFSGLTGGLFALGVLYFVLRLSVFPPAGKLTVQTDPGGAQILIDLAAARPSPILDLILSPGRHNVTARWDDYEIDTTVIVVAGQSTMLVLTSGSPPRAESPRPYLKGD
ncbi:MAG TPA: hypothetical protein VK569_02765 [Bacteroidota bacterium]|nr:hypothetical protein [Bacteroidota bacterium]